MDLVRLHPSPGQLGHRQRAKRRARTVKYGSKPFSIRSGRTKAVRVKLSRKAKRLLRKRNLKAVAVIRTRDAGRNRKTTSLRLTLKAR